MSEADPRIVALEKQFNQIHVQLFDTFSHAQSAVMTVMQTGRDIDEHHDDYTQLKRDFDGACIKHYNPYFVNFLQSSSRKHRA